MSKLWCVKLIMILASFSLIAVEDPRMCGEPERTKSGRIKRSSKVLRDFKKLYPCPVTMKSVGRCEGWSMDHVIPLACGGCDSIGNLQWLPHAIKSAKGKLPKDRWERKLYCNFTKPIKLY